MIIKNWTPIFFGLFNAFTISINAESDPNQLEQSDTGDLLLDFNGRIKSTKYGDPVTNGMGVIPILPSQFEVTLNAIYDYGTYTSAYPLIFGQYYACENGRQNFDEVYGPKITLYDTGNLYIYFDSPDGYSWYSFSPHTYLRNGDEISVRLEIYEDKFYATYTVNGDILLNNALASFDGLICGFDTCQGSNYRQREQYQVPVSAISLPTLDADGQGCSYSQVTGSSITTKVQIRSL